MVKKKINKKKFINLFKKGSSRTEIANYFGISKEYVTSLKCKWKLKKIIYCDFCGKKIITTMTNRKRCGECGKYKSETYFRLKALRRSFITLQENYPDLAKKYEIDMINEDGLQFREFALNDIPNYDEVIPATIPRKTDIKKEPCDSKKGFTFLVPMTMAIIYGVK